MKKIEILIGPSGSGKTTYASNKVQSDFNRYTRVNRDDIRQLLFGYNDITIDNYYKLSNLNKLEKEVTKYEDTLIYEGLESGKHVIIDNTNLNRQRDLESLKYWNVETELTFFDKELKDCIFNDQHRSRKVGETVITKQYRQYKSLKDSLKNKPIDFTPVSFINDLSKPSCIIYDIDGTLAKKGNRSPYDWKKVGCDTAIPDIKELINIDWSASFNRGHEVIICTGRDGICNKETDEWLKENDIFYDKLYIRPQGDFRPDYVVKEEMWREIAEEFYITAIYDDRLQVVRRARALGLTVCHVAYNNF